MDSSALESAESWLSIIGTFKLIAALLVAVGVAMEFGGDWISKPFEKTIEDARKLQIAQLTRETSDARGEIAKSNARVAEAETAVAVANARAAEANQKAEEEQRERLKLEAAVAPRRITFAQQQSIASALAQFSDRKIRIESYSLDPESANLRRANFKWNFTSGN
jgi:hypothetical protein